MTKLILHAWRWFRPNTWAFTMPHLFSGSGFGASPQPDPWAQSSPSSVEPPAGGLLASLGKPARSSGSGGLFDNLAQSVDDSSHRHRLAMNGRMAWNPSTLEGLSASNWNSLLPWRTPFGTNVESLIRPAASETDATSAQVVGLPLSNPATLQYPPPHDRATIAASQPIGVDTPPPRPGHPLPSWMWPIVPDLSHSSVGPMSPGMTNGASSTPQQPIDQPWNDDPFQRAAARSKQSVRPRAGRGEGAATRLLEEYVPQVGKGLLDLISLPGREPVPMPKGLHINDAGEWLVNGQPAAETAEGRAWIEDQQRRADWGPAMALMLALGRIPRAAPRGPAGHSPTPAATPSQLEGALPASGSSGVAAPPVIQNRLFDYSRLHETPNVPQFELERYVPRQGVPQRIQAWTIPRTCNESTTR